MKELKEILQLFILIILLGLTIWAIFFRKPEKIIEYRYTTITEYSPNPYVLPKPLPLPTPPSTVVFYEIDSLAIDSLKILLQDQEVIISGLKDSIRLSEAYLKQFPYNPKLLSLAFKKDSFRMDLLEITGQLGNWTFPIDLNYHEYHWNARSGFTRKNIKPTLLPPTLKEPFANYFVGGGFDTWHKMPYLSARAEKEFSSIRLYVDTRIGLLELDRSNFNVGLEYHINGKINP